MLVDKNLRIWTKGICIWSKSPVLHIAIIVTIVWLIAGFTIVKVGLKYVGYRSLQEELYTASRSESRPVLYMSNIARCSHSCVYNFP